MSEFEVKDSGKRIEYPSGFRRDVTEGKVDYTLLPLEFLERWAEHMTKGAKKYGRENWRKAEPDEVGDDGLTPLDRFPASAARHFYQWLRGDTDEDHASAVAFNIAAMEYMKQKKATTHAEIPLQQPVPAGIAPYHNHDEGETPESSFRYYDTHSPGHLQMLPHRHEDGAVLPHIYGRGIDPDNHTIL